MRWSVGESAVLYTLHTGVPGHYGLRFIASWCDVIVCLFSSPVPYKLSSMTDFVYWKCGEHVCVLFAYVSVRLYVFMCMYLSLCGCVRVCVHVIVCVCSPPPIPYKGCSRGPKLGTYSDWGFSSVLVINKHLSHHHSVRVRACVTVCGVCVPVCVVKSWRPGLRSMCVCVCVAM